MSQNLRIFLYFPNLILNLILALSALNSCKSLYDLRSYSKASVKGKISGEEWSYGYAYTDPEAKLPDGMKTMIVLTTAKTKNACPDTNDKIPDAREVAIAIDGKTGEMKIAGNSGRFETDDDAFTYKKVDRLASVAFYNPSLPEAKQYQFATTGKVKIIKIASDSIEGFVLAKINPNEFVNGKFKAKVCKYGQLN